VTIDNPIAWPEMANIPVMVTSVEESLDEQFPESPGAIRLKYEHDTYCQYSEFISPIPLTPEWLERLGFEKRESGVCYEWWNGINEVTHDWLVSITEMKDNGQFFYRNGKHTIKYVHQLQNLFFALTGEEL